MAPCTFRFHGGQCRREAEHTMNQGELGEIQSYTSTHTVNWAPPGANVCLIDYAYLRHAYAPTQPWDRHVTFNGAAWAGTVTEFPDVYVGGATELDCNRRLDSAIGAAVYDLAVTGQPIPDPVGSG